MICNHPKKRTKCVYVCVSPCDLKSYIYFKCYFSWNQRLCFFVVIICWQSDLCPIVCACEEACLFAGVWQCVCVSVRMGLVSLRTLETSKTFQGPRVLLFKGLHYLPLSLLFPSHDVFHLPAFSFSLPLLGSSCPFPSVSCPSTTQRPNNSRLCLPQAWTSSTSRLWQATVSKLLMLLLLGTGRNWLHRAGLLSSHYKQMPRVTLHTAVAPVLWHSCIMFFLFFLVAVMLWC